MDRLQITKEVTQPDQDGPANPSPVLETSQLISIPARPEARQNVAGGPPAHGWEPSGFGEGGIPRTPAQVQECQRSDLENHPLPGAVLTQVLPPPGITSR